MTRILPAALLMTVFCAGQADAQMLGGRGGRGGEVLFPGSTVQGDILRGEGFFLRGAGEYNLYSAMAGSINTDTWMRLNDYIYFSIKYENAEKARRRAAHAAKRLENYTKIHDRIKNDPNERDMINGDALNSLYTELAGPKHPPSTYRTTSFPLDADAVRKIPFFHAPHQAIVAMARVTPGPGKWPIALRGAEFQRARENYQRALDHVLELQIDRKTDKEAIEKLGVAVDDLFRRLDEVIPARKETLYLEAKNYLVRLQKSKELMKKKDLEMIIGELDRYSGTTVHDLIVFMQTYNLQFGVPEIGEETAYYPKLYAALRSQLDELQGGGGGDIPAPPRPGN